MEEIKEYRGFKVGEKIICILNNRSNLTVGKEYTVLALETSTYDDFWICVNNNMGFECSYHHTRFINKNDFREHLIKTILNEHN